MNNENLRILLKDTEKTSNVLDLIQAEIKEMSIAVYDEVYKDFDNNDKDRIERRKMLNELAEAEIKIKSFDIRTKYFNTL